MDYESDERVEDDIKNIIDDENNTWIYYDYIYKPYHFCRGHEGNPCSYHVCLKDFAFKITDMEKNDKKVKNIDHM